MRLLETLQNIAFLFALCSNFSNNSFVTTELDIIEMQRQAEILRVELLEHERQVHIHRQNISMKTELLNSYRSILRINQELEAAKKVSDSVDSDPAINYSIALQIETILREDGRPEMPVAEIAQIMNARFFRRMSHTAASSYLSRNAQFETGSERGMWRLVNKPTEGGSHET